MPSIEKKTRKKRSFANSTKEEKEAIIIAWDLENKKYHDWVEENRLTNLAWIRICERNRKHAKLLDALPKKQLTRSEQEAEDRRELPAIFDIPGYRG